MKRAPEDKLDILAQKGKMDILACLRDQSHEQEQRDLDKTLGTWAKAVVEEMHQEWANETKLLTHTNGQPKITLI